MLLALADISDGCARQSELECSLPTLIRLSSLGMIVVDGVKHYMGPHDAEVMVPCATDPWVSQTEDGWRVVEHLFKENQ